jgi:predicted dienelactone hydrolase
MWRCGLVMIWALSTLVVSLRAEDRVAGAYDPLTKTHTEKVVPLDLTIHDEARNRDIPIRVYRCGKIKAAPVLLFSHGLGGSREMGLYLGEHWAARGYIAVFLQHPGSDTSVWKGKRPAQIMTAMKEAANAENFLLRAKDVPAVLDQLEVWNKDSKHELFGAFDLEQIGMSGHSFGAVTTQAVSGQTAARGKFNLTDPRIKAALPMSPSSPAVGDPASAFGKVGIPWLLMTGTKDVSAIGGATVETRRAVYPALPPGGKYELVLDEAEHSVFTDRELPGDRNKRNPNHHRVILALSTAFWDAYLKGDERAKSWLDGEGPRAVMETKDLWQKK